MEERGSRGRGLCGRGQGRGLCVGAALGGGGGPGLGRGPGTEAGPGMGAWWGPADSERAQQPRTRPPPRFGAGHILTLRVPAARSESALALVATAFPGAELREAHGSRLRFQLPPGGRCALSRVFGELAARGAEHGVEDFSVSQTTLEEVTAAPGWSWGVPRAGRWG